MSQGKRRNADGDWSHLPRCSGGCVVGAGAVFFGRCSAHRCVRSSHGRIGRECVREALAAVAGVMIDEGGLLQHNIT